LQISHKKMKPILEVQNISKKYRIGHQASANQNLRERLLNVFRFDRQEIEDFWALNNVSFDVQPGESLGIIGRNGAGKSTLLKILSKITPPTKGKIISRGRVASLLEVGTGFHQELTGRENIFFNGSLLGMKRKEIEARFDEIIDFSGTEKFLDTPLKHYSSGMQLRLAFAVAAFLEPEILIIDEVLAVGDAEFQKKCLGKMEDVNKSGRTILFVSHNMEIIEQLCTRVILLQAGEIHRIGNTQETIAGYLKNKEAFARPAGQSIKLSENFEIETFELKNSRVERNESLGYRLILKSKQVNKISEFALLIYSGQNERMAIVDLRSQDLWTMSASGVSVNIEGTIEHLNLIAGDYSIGVYILSNLCQGNFYDLRHFEMILPKNSEITPYAAKYRGHVEFHHHFIIS
jgi:lipopolysaccharide transport system ATP-binding protein